MSKFNKKGKRQMSKEAKQNHWGIGPVIALTEITMFKQQTENTTEKDWGIKRNTDRMAGLIF